jgi:hypothetical protein
MIQNYWVSGLFPSTGILKTRKHNFQKKKEEKETPTLLDPLELTSVLA